MLAVFAERVLPFDLAAARVLAAFRVPEHAPLDDEVTAAIAQANHAIVVTRNLKHFEPLGVSCPNPLESWLAVGGATELPAFGDPKKCGPCEWPAPQPLHLGSYMDVVLRI